MVGISTHQTWVLLLVRAQETLWVEFLRVRVDVLVPHDVPDVGKNLPRHQENSNLDTGLWKAYDRALRHEHSIELIVLEQAVRKGCKV